MGEWYSTLEEMVTNISDGITPLGIFKYSNVSNDFDEANFTVFISKLALRDNR